MDFLKTYKHKTVLLSALQKLPDGSDSYETFAGAIGSLCEQSVLIPVKNSGENKKTPSLAYKFKVNQAKLSEGHKKRIHAIALELHPKLNITEYFALPEQEFEKDLPYILSLNRYLKENGLPQEFAASPERSFQLFHDEKVIDEKNGGRLLERLKLLELMKIDNQVDPAMLFINKAALGSHTTHYHLIVENRTAFYALSDCLKQTPFTSLIYGCGFKIISSVDMVEQQLDLMGERQIFYYFGDLDYSGILIWYLLYKKIGALPAVPFYAGLLAKKYYWGKEKQKRDEEALKNFSGFFTPEAASNIKNMLESGGYYPQETLTKSELQKIWEEQDWKLISAN